LQLFLFRAFPFFCFLTQAFTFSASGGFLGEQMLEFLLQLRFLLLGGSDELTTPFSERRNFVFRVATRIFEFSAAQACLGGSEAEGLFLVL
jgi:hypothetical protein